MRFAFKPAVGVVLAALLWACSTGGPSTPTDEELIARQLETLKAGVLNKDIDAIKDTISEDFYHPGMGDKDAALDLIKAGMDMGLVDNGEIDLSGVEIKIDGKTATAYPIDVSSPAGGGDTVQFQLRKEDGVWRIVGGEAGVI